MEAKAYKNDMNFATHRASISLKKVDILIASAEASQLDVKKAQITATTAIKCVADATLQLTLATNALTEAIIIITNTRTAADNAQLIVNVTTIIDSARLATYIVRCDINAEMQFLSASARLKSAKDVESLAKQAVDITNIEIKECLRIINREKRALDIISLAIKIINSKLIVAKNVIINIQKTIDTQNIATTSSYVDTSIEVDVNKTSYYNNPNYNIHCIEESESHLATIESDIDNAVAKRQNISNKIIQQEANLIALNIKMQVLITSATLATSEVIASEVIVSNTALQKSTINDNIADMIKIIEKYNKIDVTIYDIDSAILELNSIIDFRNDANYLTYPPVIISDIQSISESLTPSIVSQFANAKNALYKAQSVATMAFQSVITAKQTVERAQELAKSTSHRVADITVLVDNSQRASSNAIQLATSTQIIVTDIELAAANLVEINAEQQIQYADDSFHSYQN